MKAPTKTIIVLVCITIVLAGGGAWTQEAQQPAATPEEVLRQFSGLADWYSGDVDLLRPLLTEESIEVLGEFEEDLPFWGLGMMLQPQLQPIETEIQGERCTVTAVSAPRAVQVKLVKENDQWKIDLLGTLGGFEDILGQMGHPDTPEDVVKLYGVLTPVMMSMTTMFGEADGLQESIQRLQVVLKVLLSADSQQLLEDGEDEWLGYMFGFGFGGFPQSELWPQEVRIEGETATISALSYQAVRRIKLVKEHGEWKIDLAATLEEMWMPWEDEIEWEPATAYIEEPLPAAIPPKATLAIAPFANQSAEEGYEWLGYAFAYGTVSRLANFNELVTAGPEEIREELANEQSELTLSDITSSAAAREAGEAVHAEYVLIGNCAKSGDEIRVTAQIVEVATGNIHGERAGVREYANIFDFHAELVRWVAKALDLTTTPAGLERIEYKPTQSIPAYGCFGQGVMHYYRGEYEEAAAASQKTLDIDEHFADAYVVLAGALGCQEKYDEAIVQLKKVGKLDADRPYLHYYLGIAYRENEDYDKAVDELRQAVERKPQDIKVWRALGAAYLASADNHYYNFYGYHDLDESCPAMADSQQAANVFSRALELVPTLAEVYLRRAEACYGMCDYDAAIADCNRAIEINPKLAATYTTRGDAYDEIGDYDKALADYNQSLSLEPSAAAYQLRAYLYMRKKDYDQAIADYTRALELDPEHCMTWNNRASTYVDIGEYDLAISDATRGLELDPNHVKLIVNRAWAYCEKQDWDRAIPDLTRSIELDPVNRCWALRRRADAYYETGDYERSLANWDRWLEDCFEEEDTSKVARAWFRRAQVCHKMERYEEAITNYEQALDYHAPSDRPHIYYEMALTYKELGQFSAAREYAEKALAGRPEHKEAQELLNELDGLPQ